MKLLILFSNLHEAKLLLDWLKKGVSFDSEIKYLFQQSPESHYSFRQADMDIDLVITGNTMMDVSFQLGRILSHKKYHLVLQLGLCTSYDAKLEIGELVSVINDKAGDVGIQDEHSFSNAYESNQYQIDAYPHNRSGFINLTNAYFNVFLDIRKVASVTVNHQNRGAADLMHRKEDFNIHVETSNGLGCAYACLFQKQPFYQLRTVDFILPSKEMDKERALASLSEKAIELIIKIS